ncbi:hypothetical protein DPEC_G00348710 [Dallia pectoralis]|uniref:Uncharacterized protein n=1 Tax=Dallia pectoralis TaxID=75939 RepID=A0ACC2F1A2_DALPE|nr:hypothetical protein DPEC_G00348710 [Dallia pectoralis]
MNHTKEATIPVKAAVNAFYASEDEDEDEWHGKVGACEAELDIGEMRMRSQLVQMGVGGMASIERGVSGHVDCSLGKSEVDLGGKLKLEGRFPNASLAAGVTDKGFKVMTTAELIGGSASHGQITATLRAAADTGVEICQDQVGVQFLGTGFSIGRKTSISLFGSKFEWDFDK